MKIQPHELAEYFPMHAAERLNEMVSSMKVNGYNPDFPIILFEGKILDGRNRYSAAQLAGVEPMFKTFDGDPYQYVREANMLRRDLEAGQRYAIEKKLSAAELIGKAKANKSAAGGDRKSANSKIGVANIGNTDSEPVHVRNELARRAGVSNGTASNVDFVEAHDQELFKDILMGRITASKAKKQIETKNAHIKFTKQTKAAQKIKPLVEIADANRWLANREKCDLLLTDPPYSTDVNNIVEFSEWLQIGLGAVKDTGRAYVFIGAYPSEVSAYITQATPKHINLEQMLIWTYKNTLGNNPKDRYKLNYQFCLYYKGINAPELNCPITNEQWAVIEMNAPDGRIGDRYHTWQKPLELGEMIVRHATSEGDTVYDPFACTGTFLLAAGKLGRNAFGCDISEENLTISIERGCKHA